jgi:hypothetical protein
VRTDQDRNDLTSIPNGSEKFLMVLFGWGHAIRNERCIEIRRIQLDNRLTLAELPLHFLSPRKHVDGLRDRPELWGRT